MKTTGEPCLEYYKNNKKHHFLGCLCLCLALLTSSPTARAEGSTSRQDDIQEMRTLAISVTANVLVYFNLNGTPYDIGNGEAYRRDMSHLLKLSRQFGHGPITEQAQLLGTAIADLENLPQSGTEARSALPAYARWLPPVIDAHVQLDSSLSALYGSLAPTSEIRRALHDLSHDIGHLLLDYQRASFPYLSSVWLPDDQAIIALDASLEHRFAALSAQDARLAQALEGPARNYHFVRQRLLTPGPGQWAPNAVERYLMRAMQALDAEARR